MFKRINSFIIKERYGLKFVIKLFINNYDFSK